MILNFPENVTGSYRYGHGDENPHYIDTVLTLTKENIL